jgi:hypothetical protein
VDIERALTGTPIRARVLIPSAETYSISVLWFLVVLAERTQYVFYSHGRTKLRIRIHRYSSHDAGPRARKQHPWLIGSKGAAGSKATAIRKECAQSGNWRAKSYLRGGHERSRKASELQELFPPGLLRPGDLHKSSPDNTGAIARSDMLAHQLTMHARTYNMPL